MGRKVVLLAIADGVKTLSELLIEAFNRLQTLQVSDYNASAVTLENIYVPNSATIQTSTRGHVIFNNTISTSFARSYIEGYRIYTYTTTTIGVGMLYVDSIAGICRVVSIPDGNNADTSSIIPAVGSQISLSFHAYY